MQMAQVPLAAIQAESRKDTGIVARLKRTAPLDMRSINRHLESDPVAPGRRERFRMRDLRVSYAKKRRDRLVECEREKAKKLKSPGTQKVRVLLCRTQTCISINVSLGAPECNDTCGGSQLVTPVNNPQNEFLDSSGDVNFPPVERLCNMTPKD